MSRGSSPCSVVHEVGLGGPECGGDDVIREYIPCEDVHYMLSYDTQPSLLSNSYPPPPPPPVGKDIQLYHITSSLAQNNYPLISFAENKKSCMYYIFGSTVRMHVPFLIKSR